MAVLPLPLPRVTAKSPITTMANQLFLTPASNEPASCNSTASSVILISSLFGKKHQLTVLQFWRRSRRNNRHFSLHIPSIMLARKCEAYQIIQHDIPVFHPDFINISMIDFHAMEKPSAPTLRRSVVKPALFPRLKILTQFIKHELSKQTLGFYKFPDCTLKHYSFQTGWKRKRCVCSDKFMGTISRMCAGIKRKYVTGFKDAKRRRFCFWERSFIKLCRQCLR